MIKARQFVGASCVPRPAAGWKGFGSAYTEQGAMGARALFENGFGRARSFALSGLGIHCRDT